LQSSVNRPGSGVTPFASPALISLPRPADSFLEDDHEQHTLGDRSMSTMSLLQVGVFPVISSQAGSTQQQLLPSPRGQDGVRASTL
jgi:hypothetical protein